MGGMDSSSGRAEMAVLSRELERLREENARLSRLLDLRGWDTAPAAEQPVMPLAAPGMVTMASSLDDKLRLYADRFRARRDVYAVRWENARSGLSGWSPAVATIGGQQWVETHKDLPRQMCRHHLRRQGKVTDTAAICTLPPTARHGRRPPAQTRPRV